MGVGAMKLKSVLASAVLLAAATTYSLTQKTPSHPVSEYLIERTAYALSYDGRLRQARWVHEVLTADNLKGSAKRDRCDFQEDPLIPQHVRSTKSDYAKSGFDRGHLCPAADAHRSEDAMQETFYLSNISPQVPQFNRGIWAKLEERVRELAKTHQGEVHVFTGGLFLPHEENGKRYVTYQVIGESDIGVPTHFFKVVMDSNRKPIEAYILPNEPAKGTPSLDMFKVSLEQVERAAGLSF